MHDSNDNNKGNKGLVKITCPTTNRILYHHPAFGRPYKVREALQNVELPSVWNLTLRGTWLLVPSTQGDIDQIHRWVNDPDSQNGKRYAALVHHAMHQHKDVDKLTKEEAVLLFQRYHPHLIVETFADPESDINEDDKADAIKIALDQGKSFEEIQTILHALATPSIYEHHCASHNLDYIYKISRRVPFIFSGQHFYAKATLISSVTGNETKLPKEVREIFEGDISRVIGVQTCVVFGESATIKDWFTTPRDCFMHLH